MQFMDVTGIGGTMTGIVYIVGAGPGDPGLITVKGLELLRRADVIIYDRLIPNQLLDEVKPDAEKIDVGKLPQKQRIAQEAINALLVEHALHGKLVVRLKGGDPFVFGRGGEEAIACYEAGIPFEVVPGVTSAVAVPAYAGVPVTQRQISSAFTVFTGHEDPTTGESNIDYAALTAAARLGTLVLMMGVSYLPHITQRLVKAGLSADTPVLCVSWGTTPDQQEVEGTLGTIAEAAQAANLQPPAITIIGQVVGLRALGTTWFHRQSSGDDI
jgi:uroporphyrinogen III methyltransferase/synthase